MQLHYAKASPYTRKVLVVAHETGLAGRIERLERTISPVSPDPALNAANPLGKIPCLVTDDGTALFDSRVICAFLDTLHDGPPLCPADGAERWRVLRLQALGDGIMDAAVGTRYETFLRPESLRWPDWIEHQKQKVRRALDALDADVASLGDGVDLGTIAIGCALGYLDFRFPDEGWRSSRPALAAWFEAFDARASMRATAPA